MDGYSNQELETYNEIEALYNHQLRLNDEISNITNELNTLPEIPYDLDKWIDSIPEADKKTFKLVDFKRLFAINKQYEKLIEERDRNASKMKSMVVDNLLDRIKEILGE